MKYHIIENGIVTNTIMCDDPSLFPNLTLVEATEGGPGWSYANGVFTEPEPVVPVPTEIHIAWLRAALAEEGVLDDVNAAVASAGAVKQALWEYATTIRRADPDVVAIAGALSLDLDALFIRADEIRIERQG